MSLSRLKAARAAALVAACMVLQLSSSYAQTPAPEESADPNEVLVFEQMRVPRWLAETVVRAAQATNVDPAYMLALADKESSLLPDRTARTSSAAGLFQFVETTWLEVLDGMVPSTATRLKPRRFWSSKGGLSCPTPSSVRRS